MAITKIAAALYTTDGTTLTRVDAGADTTSGLLDTNNTRYEYALTLGTVVLNPGQVYYVALLVDAGTSGNHQGKVKTANVVAPTSGDQPAAMYTKASETTLAATYTIAALTEAWDLVPYVALIP